jgi:hypothetical protein
VHHQGDDTHVQPEQPYADEPTTFLGDPTRPVHDRRTDPTTRLDDPTAYRPDLNTERTVPFAHDRTIPAQPEDHADSMTVAAALPKRVPAQRLSDSNPPGSGSQAPITLRIGRGVQAVERSRQVRSTAHRFWARTLRTANIVLTVAVIAAGSWAGWQWWQRWHPQLRVSQVTVAPATAEGGCDTVFDLVGTVASNGKAGSIKYQWVRSDGAATKELNVNVPAGQTSTVVHLYWTFSGAGSQSASATLKVLGPNHATASGQFSYACGG